MIAVFKNCQFALFFGSEVFVYLKKEKHFVNDIFFRLPEELIRQRSALMTPFFVTPFSEG